MDRKDAESIVKQNLEENRSYAVQIKGCVSDVGFLVTRKNGTFAEKVPQHNLREAAILLEMVYDLLRPEVWTLENGG
jgi:hypothetical protein